MMIKQIIFPKPELENDYDNLRLLVGTSAYMTNDGLLEVLKTIPIGEMTRALHSIDGVYRISGSVLHPGYVYLGVSFTFNHAIDSSISFSELQMFLSLSITAKIEELSVVDVPSPVAREDTLPRSFVVANAWSQPGHQGGRTVVYDYQLVDGVYRSIGSRVVVTNHYTSPFEDRHWEEVRRQSPFELEFLSFDAEPKVDNHDRDRMIIETWQTINPNRPRRIQGFYHAYTLKPNETAWSTLLTILLAGFNRNVIPFIEMDDTTINTLLKGY